MPGRKRGRYASLRQHLAWIIERDPKAEQATIARDGLRKDKAFVADGCGSHKVTGWRERLHKREELAAKQVVMALEESARSAKRYTELAMQKPGLVRLNKIAKSRLPWRLFRVLWAALKLALLRRV